MSKSVANDWVRDNNGIQYTYYISNDFMRTTYGYFLTFSAWQSKTATCANNLDPDETAYNEPSSQILHRLPFCLYIYINNFRLKTLFASIDIIKFKDWRVHFRNSGMEGLLLI